MLNVNADDYGRSRDETDTVLACYEKARITSTSAMVFMSDSERAAELSKSTDIPVGLHLNLSESFTAKNVPPALRKQHDRVCRFLKSNKYTLILYNPILSRDFSAVVKEQYVEFRRLFGHEPSHIDGHQHMHLATNVLLQRLLTPGVKVRRSFSFESGQKSRLNRWYRRCVDKELARHHPQSDYFFSLSHHLSVDRAEKIATLARNREVELMVHTAINREFDFLMSDDFPRILGSTKTASIQSTL